MPAGSVYIGEKAVPIWPDNQHIEPGRHETIFVTRFADTEHYHDGLRNWLLKGERDPQLSRKYYRGACGTKIHHIEDWGLSEADLLHERALELYRRVLDSATAVPDVTWASIYRNGDYCMPHSHTRSTASVLYFLENGDTDPDDPLSGRFCFCDPRLGVCCPEQDGCVTVSHAPEVSPGTMIIFPSQVVHSVNPYTGEQPRITLSWNLNPEAVPGEALPADMRAGVNTDEQT